MHTTPFERPGWRQHAARVLRALRRPRAREPLPIELERRRIYMLPTRFALGFGVLLLAMLVGALNYTNNAALLLTCLLGVALAASMLITFRALDGLRLVGVDQGEAVAGTPLPVTLQFESARPRAAVRVDLGEVTRTFGTDGRGRSGVALSMPTDRRGWQPLPHLRVWTTWPLGLFRAWSWLRPEQRVLVWPTPETGGPSPQAPADEGRMPRLHRGEDVAGLRDYRPGDPPRHIAWKASARTGQLLTLDFEEPESRLDWRLDWRDLGALAHEARIARLARWVTEAHEQGRRHSLWLPTEVIEPGSGPAHYARCMTALALLP